MVAWFEIPVIDMDRAITFYESVFNIKLNFQKIGNEEMAFFPFSNENTATISGALINNAKYYTPSDKGVQVYFASQVNDIDVELSKVELAGGKLLQSKKLISEQIGYMGLFIDTEGNRIAMYGK